MLGGPSTDVIRMADVIVAGTFTAQDVDEEVHRLKTPRKVGSRGGIRTPDRVVNSHLLCQLSYPGTSQQLFWFPTQWLIPKTFGTLPAELPGSILTIMHEATNFYIKNHVVLSIILPHSVL